MAVTTLPRTHSRRASVEATSLPPLVLVAALTPLGLDLLARLETTITLETAALVCAGIAVVGLALTWLRYPRTAWLAAAVLAVVASLALRIVGAQVAPVLSLLAVLAIGIGGGFSSPTSDLRTLLETQPSVARR